uniref:Uncharacterized protein n=1 Tax=Arundo donax TaxID=35708 RepID=A0A0A9A5M7_ARUDO
MIEINLHVRLHPIHDVHVPATQVLRATYHSLLSIFFCSTS